MALRRVRPEHLKELAWLVFPASMAFFGYYQQFLWDKHSTMYRNKSKLFGGKKLKDGEEAWY